MTKSVIKYNTELLSLLTERFSNMRPAKPNMTLGDDGVLRINVMVGDMWYDWYVDMDGPELSAVDMVDLLAKEFELQGIQI